MWRPGTSFVADMATDGSGAASHVKQILAREAAERMKQTQTHGSIVLIATMQAAALFPGSTAYAGAKAALVHAARILAKECRGPHDIRVNVICPGVKPSATARMPSSTVAARATFICSP